MGQTMLKKGYTLLDKEIANNTTVTELANNASPNDIEGSDSNNKNTAQGTYAPIAAPTAKPLPTAPTYDGTFWDDTSKGQAALDEYNSAKDAVNNYGDFTYGEYEESDAVKGAGDALDAYIANKPGEYQSQWKNQLDALMNQILNRDKFSYDLNGDAFYQQYKDKYIQQGKMAMGDAIGQASAMTGGYGNSYAHSVGQQMYQKELQNLNDIVPELYQLALDKYNMDGQELYNKYGMVMDRENSDYGRYRDTVSDWNTERDYLTGRYDSERNFDYGKYMDDRNFAYSQYQDGYDKLMDALGIARSDYYDGGDVFRAEQNNKNSIAGQTFDDAMKIWNADNTNAWNEAEWNRDQAWRDEDIKRQDDRWKVEDEQWQQSQTSNGGSNPAYNADGTPKEGYTTNNSSYFDKDGNFNKATMSRIDDNGNVVWYIDGKEVIRQPGANPYTGATNPDIQHGTFSNGYQPDNVGGQKLSKSGITDTINGVTQNVWKTPDGTLWIWDGTQNKYLIYGNSPTNTSAGSGSGSVGGGSKLLTPHVLK